LIKAISPDLPTRIKYVRQYKARKVVYDVEMFNPSDSQEIRDAFGLFWRKRSGRRLPDELKGVSVSNVTTFPTRVRVRLLKEVSRRHQAANPHLSCFVTNYLPRPELKIRDRKGPILSMDYTETVQKMSHHLTLDFLTELCAFAKTNLPETEVAERFLVLSPDFLDKNLVVQHNDGESSMSVDEVSPNPVPGNAPNNVSVEPNASQTSQFISAPSTSWAEDHPPSATPTGTTVGVNQLVMDQAMDIGAEITLSQQDSLDPDEDPLKKRNQDRFLKRSQPYAKP